MARPSAFRQNPYAAHMHPIHMHPFFRHRFGYRHFGHRGFGLFKIAFLGAGSYFAVKKIDQ